MTGSTHHDQLTVWLDEVAHNLPQQLARNIWAELTAHVEDAVADTVKQGVPEEAAYQRVLAALGDPHHVARGFKDVHLGRYHYMAAIIAGLMLMFWSIGSSQIRTALGLVEGTMPSRILYIVDHALSTSILIYIVVTFRRLLDWRFNNQTVDVPTKIALGGLAMYLFGNAIAELTVDSWSPIPTFLNASGVVEGAGLLIMHGSMLIFSIGILLILASSLPTKNKLLKTIVVLGSIQSVSFILSIILMHLGMPLASLFGHLCALMNLAVWPALGFLFLQALFTHRRLPTQMA